MTASETSQHTQPELQALLAQAIEQMDVAVMVTDVGGQIVWVNDAFCRISGHHRHDVIGRSPSILKSGEQSADVYRQLWHDILAGKVWQGRIVEARKDGTRYTADETITPLRDDSGAIRYFVAVQHDVTQRELAHQHDRYLARHDLLTGLPNRALLADIVNKAISNASRTQQLLAILFVDLDGFKPVNDQYGHAVGDRLLTAVAERLRSAVRQSDTVARVGGDEFAALAAGIASREDASSLARKLLDALASPFIVRGHKLAIGASVGIAMFPFDGADVDTLLDNADHAMYQAKLDGGQEHRFFVHREAGVSSASGAAGSAAAGSGTSGSGTSGSGTSPYRQAR